MTFEEWNKNHGYLMHRIDDEDKLEIWQAAQEAERERIKSSMKEAAENLWCIRNQVGEEPFSLYIGPSLNTLEGFVNRLLEEG